MEPLVGDIMTRIRSAFHNVLALLCVACIVCPCSRQSSDLRTVDFRMLVEDVFFIQGEARLSLVWLRMVRLPSGTR